MSVDATLHFQNILWLWALLLLVPLTALFFYAQKKRELLLSKIVATRLRTSLVGHVSMVKRVLRAMLALGALGFLLIALAGPRLGYEEHVVPSHGRDIMLAIDTSRSMLATDVTPTRLARAKLLAEDVLELLPGDRVGLIAFAGKAFLQAPMTLDHQAVRDALNDLDTNIIPKGGTNISEAIHLTMTALDKGEGSERALILMTDGEDLGGDALQAAQEAKEDEIQIFTIGIGSPEGSLIPILNEQNGHDFVRDEHGKTVLSKLDIGRLQEIASITGGFYEPFGNNAARNIVQKGILPLSGVNGKTQVTRRPIERYEWPLSAALFLLVLWWLLDERRRYPQARRGLLLILLFLFPTLGNTTPGLNEYNQGNYGAALTTFEEQLKHGNDSDEARFDAGAAAYKQGYYKKAIDYFTGAMTSSSPKIQQASTYNLANALAREGERVTSGPEKLSDWKSAIEHYDTVLKADPNNKQAKENQAIVKKMIEDFKKQEEQQKKNPNKDQNQQQQDSQKNQQQQQNPNNNGQGNSSQNQQQQQNSNQQPQNQQQNSNQSQDPQKNGTQNPSSLQDPQKNPSSPQSGSTPGDSPSPSPKDEKNEAKNPSNSNQGEKPTPTPASGQQQASEQGTPSPTPTPHDQHSSGLESQQQPQNLSSSNAAAGNQKNSDSVNSEPSSTPQEKKQGSLNGGEQKAPAATPVQEGEGGTMSKAQAEDILRSMKDEEQQVQFQHRKESEETTKDW
ncbi:MAG: VWA domain-containing protein [Chthoniobacterales bacterium]